MKRIFTLLLTSISVFASSQTIFKGDFNNGIIADANIANTWRRYAPDNPVPNDHRWKLDSVVRRQGKYSLRIEVRPGDTTNDRSDRAEIAGMYDSAGNRIIVNDKTPVEYFAFSIRLNPRWKPPSKNGIDTSYMVYHGVFLQLRKLGIHVDSTQPAFSMQATDHIYISQSTGDVYDPVRTQHALSDSSLRKGKWIDFVVKFMHSINDKGSLMIWRRNEGKTKFKMVFSITNINTLFYQTVDGSRVPVNHEWHTGYYRSIQLQDSTGVTNILRLDGYTLATTSEAAQSNAFGSVVPLPYDDTTNKTMQNVFAKVAEKDMLLTRSDFYESNLVISTKNNNTIFKIEVYDMNRRIILQKNTNSKNVYINKSELEYKPGIYFIKAQTDRNVLASKIIL